MFFMRTFDISSYIHSTKEDKLTINHIIRNKQIEKSDIRPETQEI